MKRYYINKLNPASHTHCQVAQADTQAKTWQRVCLPIRTTQTTDKHADKKNNETLIE
jgi:hypothetical protein